MSERAYQTKMLNSKSKIVFCNWDRGKGKSYSTFSHMVTHGGIYTIVSDINVKKAYDSLFKDWHEEYGSKMGLIESFKNTKNSIEITTNKKGCTYLNFRNLKINFISSIRDVSILTDYIVFEEYLPSLSELTHSFNVRGLKQIFIMNTLGAIEYISDVENKDITNRVDFIDKQIDDLLIEFSEVEKSEKTTRTRNDIINQINILVGIKEKLNIK